MKDGGWNRILWQQFGASLDMLENAIDACPDRLWGDTSRTPQYWYLVFHTLFWLDHDFRDPDASWAPQAPFGLEEMDPAGVLPPRVYTRDEMRRYLEHGRARARRIIEALTDASVTRFCEPWRSNLTELELVYYTMRHIHHHVGQLHLILRQVVDDAPRWVSKARQPLET